MLPMTGKEAGPGTFMPTPGYRSRGVRKALRLAAASEDAASSLRLPLDCAASVIVTPQLARRKKKRALEGRNGRNSCPTIRGVFEHYQGGRVW